MCISSWITEDDLVFICFTGLQQQYGTAAIQLTNTYWGLNVCGHIADVEAVHVTLHEVLEMRARLYSGKVEYDLNTNRKTIMPFIHEHVGTLDQSVCALA